MRTSQNHAELYEATLNLLANIVARASTELMSSKRIDILITQAGTASG